MAGFFSRKPFESMKAVRKLMMMSKKKKRSTTISNQNVALPVNQRANALLPLRCAELIATAATLLT